MDYYTAQVSEALRSLDSSKDGLSEREAKKRLEEYGSNELATEDGISALSIFVDQFKNALILLLIFAGILSLFLGEALESIAIFAILFLNAILGFFQEYRAEKAIEELKKISSPSAKVLRDGKRKTVPASEVVPGDILILETGDIVPADSRVIESSSLQVDESPLTGESVPSEKRTDSFDSGTPVADLENMAFMGTSVTYGKGKSLVTATGMNTEFGKIASSLSETEEVRTPLQIKFEKLAKQIGMAAVVLIIIVLISGILQGTLSLPKMVLFALVLAVATVPSALPVIVTVGLSKGSSDLADRNMLIKKLPAAESLGAATIICSDKTGTITRNEMTVTDIFYDNKRIGVSGSGYEPEGDFFFNDEKFDPDELDLFLRIGYLCNNAKLTRENNEFDIAGDPTEGSLVVLGKKGGLDDKELRDNFSLIKELPFDSDRKRMSVVYENNSSAKKEAYLKGAPGSVLQKCNYIYEDDRVRRLTKEDRNRILKQNESFANDALRVLAFAYRDVSEVDEYTVSNVEEDLVFMGLVGMIDPPREEVKHAVERCRHAGIEAMIITGDHALTTKAIAQQIGLFKQDDIAITGDDIEKMGEKELAEKIDHIRIVARALPAHKSRIVDALQEKGHIVAMTGDGVNDAPALKKADMGIAMGITGTDVAKEVSGAILTDDNFATIVNAVEQGRNIYDKIINSAKYLLSCNSGEIATVLIAILVNLPLPLLPLQLLLINMLTDTFPALGLGFEPPARDIMERSPRDPDEKPITKTIFVSIVAFGLIMATGTLFMFSQYKDLDLDRARTIAFTTLVLFQMFAVMSSRPLSSSLSKLNPFTNKWLFAGVFFSIAVQATVVYFEPLQAIFETAGLAGLDWLKIVAISSLGFILMELSSFFVDGD